MSSWIRSNERLPEEHQKILVTVEHNGKKTVAPCWVIDNNRIMFSETPNAPSYSFAMVKAWLPFPEPYQE